MPDLTTLAILAGFVIFYAVGRGIGKAVGREESTNTVIVVQLDGETVGSVKIAGVLVVPNATHLMTPRPEADGG